MGVGEPELPGATNRAEGYVDRVFGRRGPGAAINALLERSGFDLRPGEAIGGVLAAAGGVAVLMGLLGGWPAAGVGGVVVVLGASGALA